MALIKVGGSGETEQQEIRDKLVDGLNATKTSCLYGYLPGGGVSLLHSAKLIDSVSFDNFEEKAGGNILKKALCSPFVAILDNSGLSGNYWKEELIKENDWRVGVCLKTNKKKSMIEDGVLDSYKNISSYLEDACSMGGYLLSAKCLIANKKIFETPAYKDLKPKEMF